MGDNFAHVLGAVIAALPQPQRVLLALMVDWELTLAEIAVVLDVPLVAAAALQRDLFRTLLRALQARWNREMAYAHSGACLCAGAHDGPIPAPPGEPGL